MALMVRLCRVRALPLDPARNESPPDILMAIRILIWSRRSGAAAWSVALGKFDSDTNLDMAVVNYSANTVTVFTGNGDGTFQVRSNYQVGVQPYHIATGDFNGDGNLDLAVPNLNSDNISILLGNGDGSFHSAVNYPVGD